MFSLLNVFLQEMYVEESKNRRSDCATLTRFLLLQNQQAVHSINFSSLHLQLSIIEKILKKF